MMNDDTQQPQARVKSTYGGGWLADWQPGLALPVRFTSTIDADWLPYRVELELVTVDGEVTCAALRLEVRAGSEPLTARGLRAVPLGECIRLAIASVLRPFQQEHDQFVVDLARSYAEPIEIASRDSQRHGVPEAWLREAAQIYLDAGERPTQAVRRHHSQAPISYSTAARWVMQARQRGFLPPVKRHRKPKEK